MPGFHPLQTEPLMSAPPKAHIKTPVAQRIASVSQTARFRVQTSLFAVTKSRKTARIRFSLCDRTAELGAESAAHHRRRFTCGNATERTWHK